MNAVKSQTVMAPRTSGWRTGRFARWFLLSAGGILLVTGVAKVVSASGNARILDSADPIFAISFRHLLLSVGILELAVCAICLLSGRTKLASFLVAWLAANFVLYRAGLWFVGWNRPCNCLGNLTDALHLSPRMAETTAQTLCVYLLAGSLATIITSLKSPSRPDTVIGA